MVIRSAEDALLCGTVQRQPVAELEAKIPEVLLPSCFILFSDTFHPIPHQRIMLCKYIAASVVSVQHFR